MEKKKFTLFRTLFCHLQCSQIFQAVMTNQSEVYLHIQATALGEDKKSQGDLLSLLL